MDGILEAEASGDVILKQICEKFGLTEESEVQRSGLLCDVRHLKEEGK